MLNCQNGTFKLFSLHFILLIQLNRILYGPLKGDTLIIYPGKTLLWYSSLPFNLQQFNNETKSIVPSRTNSLFAQFLLNLSAKAPSQCGEAEEEKEASRIANLNKLWHLSVYKFTSIYCPFRHIVLSGGFYRGLTGDFGFIAHEKYRESSIWSQFFGLFVLSSISSTGYTS